MEKIYKKEKTAVISCGLAKWVYELDNVLCYIHAERLYKLFGMQSQVGGISIHASLKNWKSPKTVWVRISYENPTPGALSEITINKIKALA